MEGQELLRTLPPNNIDAERSVLGAMLQDSSAATLSLNFSPPVTFTPRNTKKFLTP